MCTWHSRSVRAKSLRIRPIRWGLDPHCGDLESPGVSHLRLQSCVALREAGAAVVGAAAPSGSGGADEGGLLRRRAAHRRWASPSGCGRSSCARICARIDDALVDEQRAQPRIERAGRQQRLHRNLGDHVPDLLIGHVGLRRRARRAARAAAGAGTPPSVGARRGRASGRSPPCRRPRACRCTATEDQPASGPCSMVRRACMATSYTPNHCGSE